MASKAREVREAQKAYWEKKLSQRLGVLSAQGVSPEESEKDPVIRGIKSKISDTKARIRTIAAAETKLVDMARLKEEKKAAPPKEKGKKAPVEAPAAKESKKKAKGAEKKEPKEPKAEKVKKEKAPKEAKTETEPSPEPTEALS